MIIFRVFEGDNYMHFNGQTKAYDAADKIADKENCGPNGFVIIDKLTLIKMTANQLVVAALNDQSVVENAERIYERMAR